MDWNTPYKIYIYIYENGTWLMCTKTRKSHTADQTTLCLFLPPLSLSHSLSLNPIHIASCFLVIQSLFSYMLIVIFIWFFVYTSLNYYISTNILNRMQSHLYWKRENNSFSWKTNELYHFYHRFFFHTIDILSIPLTTPVVYLNVNLFDFYLFHFLFVFSFWFSIPAAR